MRSKSGFEKWLEDVKQWLPSGHTALSMVPQEYHFVLVNLMHAEVDPFAVATAIKRCWTVGDSAGKWNFLARFAFAKELENTGPVTASNEPYTYKESMHLRSVREFLEWGYAEHPEDFACHIERFQGLEEEELQVSVPEEEILKQFRQDCPESSRPLCAVGDVVVLASGGPKMVVQRRGREDVICAWFDESGKNREHGFPKACLMPCNTLGVNVFVEGRWEANGKKAKTD